MTLIPWISFHLHLNHPHPERRHYHQINLTYRLGSCGGHDGNEEMADCMKMDMQFRGAGGDEEKGEQARINAC